MTLEEKWAKEASQAWRSIGTTISSEWLPFKYGFLAGRWKGQEECINKKCPTKTKAERLQDFLDEIARQVENEKDIEEEEGK